jgi:hypothetical protein
MAKDSFDLSDALDEVRSRLAPAIHGHGAHLSFDDAVADFPTDLRNERPPNVGYTFWAQLEHIRIAQWDLLQYATDPNHQSPEWPKNYWPAETERADDEAWNATISRYQEDRDRLVALIQDKSVNLLEPVEHMGGRSIMRACVLVIDHTAYHLGEFVMGRQILGHWKSALNQ